MIVVEADLPISVSFGIIYNIDGKCTLLTGIEAIYGKSANIRFVYTFKEVDKCQANV